MFNTSKSAFAKVQTRLVAHRTWCEDSRAFHRFTKAISDWLTIVDEYGPFSSGETIGLIEEERERYYEHQAAGQDYSPKPKRCIVPQRPAQSGPARGTCFFDESF
jgi:hypothetical protein